MSDTDREALTDTFIAEGAGPSMSLHLADAFLASDWLAAHDAEERAKAWDEGWCAGVSRFTQRSEPPKDNPHRARADRESKGGAS